MNKFISRFGGPEEIHITPAQYITEELCIKIAHSRKCNLVYKFWTLPEWEKEFRRHVASANTLLRIYSPGVIIAAMRDVRLNKMMSFRFPPFMKILDEYQSKEDEQKRIKTQIHEIEEGPKKPRKALNPNSFSIFGELSNIHASGATFDYPSHPVSG